VAKKRYLNTHYGHALFGGTISHGIPSRIGRNPRAGMSYSLGLNAKGEVVHIYKDGERIVMHTHAAHAAPPHPSSFGGMAGPGPDDARFLGDHTKALLAAQAASKLIQHPHRTAAQDTATQSALQAALAAFSGS
jgi:hypothetical protein